MTIFHYVSITPLINPLNILLLSDRTFVAPYASLGWAGHSQAALSAVGSG